MNLLLILLLTFQASPVASISTVEAAAGMSARRGMAVELRAPRLNYTFELRDKDGALLWTHAFHNVVTTEGANNILSCYFKVTSCPTNWYVGLIDNTGFTAVAATDTAAKITTSANPPTTNGWQELSDYDEANRQALTLGSVSAGSVDNSAAKATFTMTGSGTIKGAYLSTSNTKSGGTSGVLYAPAAFGSTQPYVPANVLTVTATITQQ